MIKLMEDANDILGFTFVHLLDISDMSLVSSEVMQHFMKIFQKKHGGTAASAYISKRKRQRQNWRNHWVGETWAFSSVDTQAASPNTKNVTTLRVQDSPRIQTCKKSKKAGKHSPFGPKTYEIGYGNGHLNGQALNHQTAPKWHRFGRPGKDMSKDKRSIQKLRREVEKTKRALSSTHQAGKTFQQVAKG